MNTLNGGTPGYLNARVGIEQEWVGVTRVRVGYALDRFLLILLLVSLMARSRVLPMPMFH